MIYYIADTHFGHRKVIHYDQRPFSTIEEMDETIIKNWNSVVSDEDDVYILGDFVYKSRYDPVYYLSQLKGKKHLIVGNHDQHLLKNAKAMAYFDSVDDLLEIQDGLNKVILCHYPMAEWNQFHRHSYHVHGHIHNRVSDTFHHMSQLNAYNAGCMIHDYQPVTLTEMMYNMGIFVCQHSKVEERSKTIEELIADVVDETWFYPYIVNGEDWHSCYFEEVLKNAYKYYDTFHILDEDEHYYSQQQLKIIKKFIHKKRNEGGR